MTLALVADCHVVGPRDDRNNKERRRRFLTNTDYYKQLRNQEYGSEVPLADLPVRLAAVPRGGGY